MAQQRGFRFYLWQMHGLSARAESRGERATKNIRKYGFYEVSSGGQTLQPSPLELSLNKEQGLLLSVSRFS